MNINSKIRKFISIKLKIKPQKKEKKMIEYIVALVQKKKKTFMSILLK